MIHACTRQNGGWPRERGGIAEQGMRTDGVKGVAAQARGAGAADG